MKYPGNILIYILLAVIFTPRTMSAQNEDNGISADIMEQDDEAVKTTVEAFLEYLGKGDINRVREMFLPDANIASITMQNGQPRLYTITAEEYLTQREEKGGRIFEEPVRHFTINISQGLLAFVRADATVIYEGKPSHHTQDFFILMKDQGVWKFLSASYTTLPLD